MARIFAVFLLFAAPALAEGTEKREAGVETWNLPGIDHYCTGSNGERYELGEIICIAASCQTWMAKCDMSLNNTMWRKMQDGCPTASAKPSLKQKFDKLRPVLEQSRMVDLQSQS